MNRGKVSIGTWGGASDEFGEFGLEAGSPIGGGGVLQAASG